jgi:hypothetical protein
VTVFPRAVVLARPMLTSARSVEPIMP